MIIMMFRGELWVGLHSGVLLKVTDRQRSRAQTLIAKSQKEDKSLNLWWSFEDFQSLSKWWPPFYPILTTNFPMHPKFARQKLQNIFQRWSTSQLIISLWKYFWLFCHILSISSLLIACLWLRPIIRKKC